MYFQNFFTVNLLLYLPLQSEFPVATGHRVALHYFVLRVGQVVALYGGLQVVSVCVECLVEFHIHRVPSAEQVVGIV